MNKATKERLKSVPLVGTLLKSLNRLYNKLRAPLLVPSRQLRWHLRGSQNLIVLQIGSNDGVSSDPLYRLLRQNLDWEAFLVEPVPSLFDKLKQSYKGRTNTHFLNIAVSDNNTDKPFYYLDDDANFAGPGIPDWYDQLGSFSREHITNCLGGNYDKYIKQILVKSVSFDNLLSFYISKPIDVLHIDTEGHDWVILRQLDLAKARPRLVLFENKHLTATETSEFLCVYSPIYNITNLGTDYLCVLKKS